MKRVKITDFAVDGRGVGRDEEGKVHFVRNGVVGEEVAVRVEKERSSYSESVAVEVLEPSPWRREPPCQYFHRCGGCPLMHVSPQYQLKWKRDAVVRELSRIFPLLPEPRVHSSPELGYRTRASLKWARRRFGFVSRSGEVFPVEFCPVLSPVLNSYLAVAEEVKWKFSSVSLSEGDDGVVMRAFDPRGEHIVAQCKRVFPVLRGLFFGDRRVHGTDVLHFMVGSATLAVSGLGFFQQNRFTRELVYTLPSSLLAKGKVLDLYAGAGIHSFFFLSRGADESFLVETNRRSLAMANENLRKEFPGKFHLVNLPAEKFEFRDDFDLVFLNPPRTGSSPELLARVGEHTSNVLYLSCDLKTLVRDLAPLSDWEVAHLAVLDQFPNTPKVEVLVWLRKN